MGLTEFTNVPARNLSGGNKRKLSCAMTLILSPKAEFLDEPTTGVDPVSRRKLFHLIKQLRDSAVVLTTHRMDEAEQLCDQIAILINGRIVVHGTPNYLMHQYGQGYIFIATVPGSQIDHAKHHIATAIPQAEFQSSQSLAKVPDVVHLVTLRYKVGKVGDGEGHVRLSTLFQSLTELVQTEAIQTFSVTRSTLAQVFTSFARFQHPNESDPLHNEYNALNANESDIGIVADNFRQVYP